MSADTLDRARRPADGPLGYLLRVSRPRFWLYLAGPVLVGVAYAAGTPRELVSPAAIVLLCYFLVPANVYLYGVNDVFDADADAENPRKGGPEARYGGDRLVPAAAAVCGLAGLAVLAALPSPARLPLAGFLLLGAAYSAPPLRLKTVPLLDSVANGLYALPGVAAYAAVAGAYPPAAAVAGGWLWTMGMHTFSAIPDVEPDRRAGIRTTATALGAGRAYAYCGACWLVAALAFLAVHPLLAASLLVYPALALAVPFSGVAVDRAYRWFPALNTVVGAVLTLGGLWVTVHG